MSWMAMNDHERFWKTVLFHSWKKKENYERNFLKCERKLKNLKEIFFHRESKPFIVERKMKEERNFVFVKELRKVMKCKKDFEKKEERKRMICEWLFFFHERRKRSMKGGEWLWTVFIVQNFSMWMMWVVISYHGIYTFYLLTYYTSQSLIISWNHEENDWK